MRPAKTWISLGIRPVRSESSLCTQWVAKVSNFLHADSEDSDQMDARADLSFRWAHMPFCWFCHAAAHLKSAGQDKGILYNLHITNFKVILNMLTTSYFV